MPRQQAQTRARTIDIVCDDAARADRILVKPRILVHSSRGEEPGEPCWCCGSTRAYVVREIEDEPVLIDTRTPDRLLKSQAKPGTWEPAIKGAQVVDLRMTITDWVCPDTGYSDLEILMDETTPVWLTSGGNRSGKSELGCYRLVRMWLRRGGPNVLFRIMAPEVKQAHIMMGKLCKGEGTKPPIIPRELIVSIPHSVDSRDQNIHLCDGTSIHLTYAGKGEHIKGVKCLYTHWTEFTACPHVSAFTVAAARAVDDGGLLYLEGTPNGAHYSREMKDEAVRVRQEELKALREGRKPEPPHTRFVSRPMSANAWLDPANVARLRAAVAARDPLEARRDFDGEWVSANATIFGEVWDGSVHVVDMPHGPDLRHLGLVDVTRKASRRFWGGSGHDWVVGVDVNRNPHTAVVCKIWEHPDSPGEWGILVWDEIRTWNASAYGAAVNLRNAGPDMGLEEGAYRGAGVAIDATAAHSNQHGAHTGGRATTPVKDYQRLGFNAKPNRHPKTGKPANPSVRDSTAMVRHLMRERVGPESKQRPRFLVSAGCSGVINAIERQEDRGDGTPVKVSGNRSDYEIAAFTDSIRYNVWAIFGRSEYRTPIEVRTFA